MRGLWFSCPSCSHFLSPLSVLSGHSLGVSVCLCDWLALGLLGGSNCVSLSLTVVVRGESCGVGSLQHKASQLEIPESLNGCPNQTTIAEAPCLLGPKRKCCHCPNTHTHTHTHAHKHKKQECMLNSGDGCSCVAASSRRPIWKDWGTYESFSLPQSWHLHTHTPAPARPRTHTHVQARFSIE